MSNTTRSTISNTILAGLFIMMIGGIASWNVTAIKDNTVAVKANTGMVYKNRQKNEKQHTELAGLIMGINYEIESLNEDCTQNKHDLVKLYDFYYKQDTKEK